jgi:hypothetical protein
MPSAAPSLRPQRFGTAGCRAAGVSPLAVALLAALAGCAAPGEPTPRRPVVPEAVHDLSARQLGDAVVLRFTVPTDSTLQEPLATPPTVEIYRAISAPGAAPAPTQQPRLADTIPGELLDTYVTDGGFQFSDPLDPAELARAAGESITYTVRTLVSGRHLSAESNAVSLRAYPAPAAPAGLGATLTQQAIDLTWTPPQPASAPSVPSPASYRIYRAELEPSGAAAASAHPDQEALRAPLVLLGTTAMPGFRDANFAFGRVYLYLVRSVAQFGSAAVESANSNAVVVSAKDVFPPAAPQALEAVVAPATAQAAAYVDLTWAFNTEPDLAGYNVFRSEQPGAPGQKLNPQLLRSPSFQDTGVTPGHRYFYRVQAVDQAGNESPFSAGVAAEVPAP